MLQSIFPDYAGFAAPRPGEGIARRAFRYLLLVLRIRRERDQLANLTDDQLADIGIGRREAEAEAQRDILDIPEHRKPMFYI